MSENDVNQQQPAAQVAPDAVEEGDVSLEEEEKLPFPNARVVNLLKKNFSQQHQIKKEVKVAVNELVGKIVEGIAREMDASPYFTLSIGHFKDAARKYLEIELTEKRILKIKKVLEKQRAELDEIIEQIEVEHGHKTLTPGQTTMQNQQMPGQTQPLQH